jgi:hypothetical protein
VFILLASKGDKKIVIVTLILKLIVKNLLPSRDAHVDECFSGILWYLSLHPEEDEK